METSRCVIQALGVMLDEGDNAATADTVADFCTGLIDATEETDRLPSEWQ